MTRADAQRSFSAQPVGQWEEEAAAYPGFFTGGGHFVRAGKEFGAAELCEGFRFGCQII